LEKGIRPSKGSSAAAGWGCCYLLLLELLQAVAGLGCAQEGGEDPGALVVGAAARGSARDGAPGAAALLEGDPANGGGCRWLCAWEKEEAAWRRSGWISGEYHGEDGCVGIGKR